MKVVATVEARMGSTRLPGKVLRPILGKPSLELLVERLRRARQVDQVVIATTDNPADDAIEHLARHLDVGCFRGSENDVLDRVVKAAQAYHTDVLVEITGDCPLLDPEVIDRHVETYLAGGHDYVANVLHRTYPAGLDTQVFSARLLEEVSRLTQDPADREHVSLYIYHHPERYRLHNVESGLPEKYHSLRLTLDTPDDLDLITAIYTELYPRTPTFNLADVLALFDRHPELADINRKTVKKKVPA